MMDEQRLEPRAESEIRIEYRSVDNFVADYALNISKGGLFIQTEHPLPRGTRVRLVFSLPDLPVIFDLSGVVQWINRAGSEEPCGMGIQFLNLDEKIRQRIEKHIKSIRAQRPQPQIKMGPVREHSPASWADDNGKTP
jgi:uncharacterized protein (TIGR02266 family)